MILCCGESLIDMIPIENTSNEVSFTPLAGGAIFNTSIALGRLNVPVGLISGVSSDFLGQKLVNELSNSNVNTEYLIRKDNPTTLAFVSFKNGHANYTFYDENSAGRSVNISDILDIPEFISTLYFGGISLCVEPAANAYEKLFHQEVNKKITFLDPNIRKGFVIDEASYRYRLEKMISSCDILKVSDEDLSWIIPLDIDIKSKVNQLIKLGAKIIIVTKGAKGASAFFENKYEIKVPAESVDIIDTVGAGDTFNAGFLAKLSQLDLLSKEKINNLNPEQMTKALNYGVKVASITVSRKGANPPFLNEV